MNIMVGLWATLVGLGQSAYPLGFTASRGVIMYALAFPFFVRALKALKENSLKNANSS